MSRHVPRCIYGRSRHKWSNNWELVGGIKENPGVWGIGGAAVAIKLACPHCGLIKTRVVGDFNVPNGWQYEED